jgi:ferric-dicitrate binding protein FerR (iron transport regulator)
MTPQWGPGPIAWIVLRAASLVPAPVCYRLEEEWLADLWALDGLLQRIRFGLGCVWAALQMRGNRITAIQSKPAHRNFFEELPLKPRGRLRIPFFKLRDRRREQASTWLARLHRGLRADEGAQLQAWLKRRSHRKCIARVAAEKDGPEDLTILAEICELKREWLETRHGRSPIINAAAVLIGIGITSLPVLDVIFPQKSFIESLGTAYTSDRHTLRHVVLPDGTQIVLNHQTRITVWCYDVWYNNKFRGAALVRGEASFTVRHTAFRPFVLDAGGRHFGTSGATFNMRLTGRAIELTVLDGVVVVPPPLVIESRKAYGEFVPPTLVKAGQTIDIESDGQSAQSSAQREVQARIAWQRG